MKPQTTVQTQVLIDLTNQHPFTMWIMKNYNRIQLEQHCVRCVKLLDSKKSAINCDQVSLTNQN